ncbi:MAG: Dam family site-specific DNA-(adenine-N6)-methyltransferase [Alcaligenaceae bacterium]|nr:Dam family site-specific DNA-(adenine-N6)-methyltransferase [Alcaligenaceae bacterium]
MKPFLKWAGGKSKLAPFILNFIPEKHSGRLIEPFVGSAALSLAIDFDEYVLNDVNPDLISLYEILQEQKKIFIDFARSLFTPENNQELKFYELRERFNAIEKGEERAALFIYLNRHAFNGLCRYNSKGGFNVPFGRYSKPYFPEAEMLGFLQKADRMQFMCSDFEFAMRLAEQGDVVYCDPPYAPLSPTASFTSYVKGAFGEAEQRRLAAVAEEIATKGAHVLLSNHDTVFTREIYAEAQLQTIDVQRNIAAKGSSRLKVGEVLAVYEY